MRYVSLLSTCLEQVVLGSTQTHFKIFPPCARSCFWSPLPKPQARGCQDAPERYPAAQNRKRVSTICSKRVEKRRGSGADTQQVENHLTCPRSRLRSWMGQMTSIQLLRSNKALFFHIFGPYTQEHVVILCFLKCNIQEIIFEGSGMYGIFTKFSFPFCFSSVFYIFFFRMLLLIYCFIILFLK